MPLVLRSLWLSAVTLAAVAPACGEEDPLRPAAIRAEGVPRVPAELLARLHQYQETRAAAFAGWAPDGRGMLVRTRFGNTPQLHRVYDAGGRREQVTFFSEPATGQFVPRARDGALLCVLSEGGNENDQVYLREPQTNRTLRLTDGVSKNRPGPVSADGSRMIVLSNRRNGQDFDLYAIDCRRAGPDELLLETKDAYWNVSDWSRDGRFLAMIRYVSINESYPALFDLREKKLLPLPLPREGKMAFGAAAFSPQGDTLFLTTDAHGEFLELAEFDLAKQTYRRLSADLAWDVDGLAVDPGSGTIAFTLNEDGASRLFLRQADRQRAVELPLGIVSGLEFSPDGARLGFTLSRPDAPPDAFSLDLADDRLVRWTYSEVGGLNPETFVTPERVKFASFDGRQVPAYLFKPRTAAAGKPVPVLIHIHGGPEGQYRPFFAGSTQFFAHELGVAVIHPNVRGSAGYGKTYLQLDNGPRREDSVRDIGGLLDWIAKQPDLDRSRVAVTGGSYGGYMVLASLVHYSDRLVGGVDHVGIASFQTFLENTSAYRRDLRRVEYGDERDPQMRAVFQKIDPLHNAEKIRTALLVLHGVNDPRVPFSEAQQIVAKVRDQKRPVWTVYADNEGHGFQKKANRDYAQAVEVLFLKQQMRLP